MPGFLSKVILRRTLVYFLAGCSSAEPVSAFASNIKIMAFIFSVSSFFQHPGRHLFPQRDGKSFGFVWWPVQLFLSLRGWAGAMSLLRSATVVPPTSLPLNHFTIYQSLPCCRRLRR